MNFFKNYFSTLLFILWAYFLYSSSGFHSNFIDQSVRIGFLDFSLYIPYVFYTVVVLYVIFLIPFYSVYPEKSKARIVIGYIRKVLRWDNSYSNKEKTALLAWIVKLFFIPLMITWFTQHVFSVINNIHNTYSNIQIFSEEFLVFFNTHFFWTAFSVILFFDVLFFTIWYLIEIPALKNTIRSVEPTVLGWIVCIGCYPPFNTYVTDVVGWYSTDFPNFGNMYAHLSMNIAILILMAIYAWASLSLGLKASNLTHRWIVRKWPYKYIRHPAYICKNSAWLLGGIPMLIVGFKSETTSLIAVCIGLFSWAFIYYLRAMTEENHLSLDPEYIKYKKEVPYKFIPKIW